MHLDRGSSPMQQAKTVGKTVPLNDSNPSEKGTEWEWAKVSK